MQGSPRILQMLNELLTLELTAINQYFLHSKLCDHWGYGRLAKKVRETAMEEMKDAEEIVERILFLEGVPNVQRLGSVTVGESVPEVLRLQLETEKAALRTIGEGIVACLAEGDHGTREFLAARLPEEEGHVDWLETQLGLVGQLGEVPYLAEQMHE